MKKSLSLRARALNDRRVRRVVIGLALTALFTTLMPRAAEASTIVVRPNDLSGWALDNQNYNTANAAPVGAFVTGPAQTPIGYGSLEQSTLQGDKQAVITVNHNGETLASLTTLKYDTFSADPSNLRPAMKLQVDTDGDGQRNTTLVYEPLYQTTAPAPDVWQTWDAAAGLWWSTTNTPAGYKTLAGWNESFGGAATIATLVTDGIRIESGSTGTSWTDNYVANVDCIVVGADTYDLEPIIVTEDSLGDWIVNDNQDLNAANGAPSGAFVTGPGSAPSGYGSFAQTVNVGDKQGVFTPAYNGSALTVLAPLKYSTYTTRDASPVLLPAMKLGVDTDNDNDRDTTLVFEPLYQTAQTAAANAWQTWDAAAGIWWSTADVAAGYKTLTEWNALFGGSAKIAVLTHDGIRIESGSTGTSWPDSVQNFDRVQIVAATYDFESLVPAAPVITAPGANASVNTTNVALVGTALARSTVELFEGDDSIATVEVDGNGNWTVSHVFATGTHAITAIATDYIGNEGVESTAHTFTVDTSAPSVPVFASPAAGAILSDPNVTVTGYAEPGTTVTLKEGATSIGSGTTTAGSTWSIPVTFPDGPHSITATATDAAGNASVTSGARSFSVDSGLPSVPAITAPTAGANLKTQAVTVSGTAQPGVTVTLKEAGLEIGTTPATAEGTWSLPMTFVDGSHSLKVLATNGSGSSPESAARTFTVDTEAPAAPAITAPAADGDKLTSQTVTVSGTAEANTFVVLKEGAGSRGTTRANAAGAWSIRTTLTEGEHTLTATGRDVAGNVGGSSSRTFSIDSVKPAMTFTTSSPAIFAPGSPVIIEGTAKDASGVATVTVEFFDFLTGDLVETVDATLTPTATGVAWSAQPTTLTIGLYDVVATVTDTYGNEKSGAVTVISLN